MTMAEADQLESALAALPGIRQVTVYDRTCYAVIRYQASRDAVIRALAAFRFDREALANFSPETSGRALNRRYQEKLVCMTLMYLVRKLYFPAPLRIALAAWRAARFFRRGLRCLLRRRLEVDVLDALSIGVSMGRGDFATAASVMFLLRLGELLEEWTRKKSLGDLARSLSLNVDQVWLKTGDAELLPPISQIQAGDQVCVRTGNVIPLDGRVVSGEASVNQASLTGESVAVRKGPGAMVYAGTVVEEGECILLVEQQAGTGRYDQIVAMIEQSERLKSAAESRALDLADSGPCWGLRRPI